MSLSGLLIHTAGSHEVTASDLASLPAPQSLGRWHRPVPHSEVLSQLMQGVTRHGWTPGAIRLGTSAKGQRLFGTIDLQTRSNGWGPDMEATLGFRSSTDQSLALTAVAGAHVFVCDNLCLSGDEILFSRKSTLHLTLPDQIDHGLAEFRRKDATLQEGVARLKDTHLGTGTSAKAAVYDLYERKVLPTRTFQAVSDAYFAPPTTWTDCQGSTLWALENACTRATKRLTAQSKFEAENRVGRHFLSQVLDVDWPHVRLG